MKKVNSIKIVIAAIFLIFNTTSCKKKEVIPDPIANFTYTETNSEAPVNITFFNSSENAVSYQWDFGDGGNSSEKSPTHQFLNDTGNPITRSVTLIVKNEANKSSTITKTLTIQSEKKLKPIANFTYSITGNFAPAKVIFRSSSANTESYHWDFGDGRISTSQSPSHIYQKGGSYIVELTVTNKNGTDKKILSINIENKPTKIKVNELKIKNIPFTTTNGGGWDGDCDGTGADLYFTVGDESDDRAFFETDTFYKNITSSSGNNPLPITFSNETGESNMPLVFNDLTFRYTIAVWDYDGNVSGCGQDDWIGSFVFDFVNFIPKDGSKYPTTLNFKLSGNELEFDLKVEWQK